MPRNNSIAKAAQAAINGVPMVEVRDLLAHKSVTITGQHYSHLHPDYRKKADNFIDDFTSRVEL